MTSTVHPGTDWIYDRRSHDESNRPAESTLESSERGEPTRRRYPITLVTESGEDASAPRSRKGRVLAFGAFGTFAALIAAIVASSAVARRPTLADLPSEAIDGLKGYELQPSVLARIGAASLGWSGAPPAAPITQASASMRPASAGVVAAEPHSEPSAARAPAASGTASSGSQRAEPSAEQRMGRDAVSAHASVETPTDASAAPSSEPLPNPY